MGEPFISLYPLGGVFVHAVMLTATYVALRSVMDTHVAATYVTLRSVMDTHVAATYVTLRSVMDTHVA